MHELAAKEFDDAIEWYELQSPGLGDRFRQAVNGQINKIKVHPGWYLIEDGDIHKAYVPKFPFKIVSPKYSEDALHVALATVAECKILVSWNFKHIVHFEKISLYNAVNVLNGYDLIQIFSPQEVISYE